MTTMIIMFYHNLLLERFQKDLYVVSPSSGNLSDNLACFISAILGRLS